MTREEAIRCLSVHSSTNGSGLCTDEQHYEAKQMAIKALEYDDAKYHAEHGEVIVDKAVWKDAERALSRDYAVGVDSTGRFVKASEVFCDRNICLRNDYNGIGCDECEVTKSQEPSGDTISRQEAIKAIDEKAKRIKNEDTLNGLAGAVGILFDLPSVNPQEPNITWVTGADGAKIAFWDVPVWKVTKICEILGEPQERSEE